MADVDAAEAQGQLIRTNREDRMGASELDADLVALLEVGPQRLPDMVRWLDRPRPEVVRALVGLQRAGVVREDAGCWSLGAGSAPAPAVRTGSWWIGLDRAALDREAERRSGTMSRSREGRSLTRDLRE